MAQTHYEPHGDITGRHNWLRAAVLGANDGIVSVAALVVGVAGATTDASAVLIAGVAGTLAGALSMAAGEYVSVSAQRDSESALLEKEKRELAEEPEAELQELTELYEAKGLSATTAALVAKELTERDAFAAHAEVELGIDPNDLTNPWHAALASGMSFTVGAALPLAAIVLTPVPYNIGMTFAAVLIALALTGSLGAYAGDANKSRATARVVLGGALAMAITYSVGAIFGVAGI